MMDVIARTMFALGIVVLLADYTYRPDWLVNFTNYGGLVMIVAGAFYGWQKAEDKK